MYTAIIIEDESTAREYLRTLLAPYSDIVVLGEASTTGEAVKLIVKQKPGLLFLDVELGSSTGFDVLHEIFQLHLHPAVIFTTGYDKYAMEAIRHSAFDYLLKPIDPAELEKVILRLRGKMIDSGKERLESLLEQLDNQKKLPFNIRSGTIFIDPEEIFYCEADGNYTYMYLTGHRKEYITCQIGHVMDLLPADRFIRLGRSLVISRHRLARIDRLKKQALLEKNGENCILELGQRQLRELSDLLDN
ncbi:MAG: LytTR family DNA-binding domain-containing protein [Bacteroidales bacterium]